MLLSSLINKLKTIQKGAYTKITYASDLTPKVAAAHRNHTVTKETTATVRYGISYGNIASVRENLKMRGAVATDPETGKEEVLIGSLPWGQYIAGFEGILIEHKGKQYVRLYTAAGTHNRPHTKYYLDGREVTRKELEDAGIMQPSFFKSSEEPDNALTINVANIVSIGD